MSYAVCIPTAGTGSRLGDLTRDLNKSLISVANRPVLSHLIEGFPSDARFVIALGHQGHLVREFLQLAYPDRDILYVDVDPFCGPGSGLGYTLRCCRPHLQTPFIFCSCDTLTSSPIPAPLHNWMAYGRVGDISPYRTLRLNDGKVVDVCEKGTSGDGLQAYIGLAGIRDCDKFWAAMERGGTAAVSEGEAWGMRQLVPFGIQAYPFVWHDTGNPNSLALARDALRPAHAPNVLDKPNEAIWFVNDKVIKFSADMTFIRNRVQRASVLSEYCPVISGASDHMYRYSKAAGEILSDIITLPLFELLFQHAQTFWKRATLRREQQDEFRRACLHFYRDKTQERVEQFYRAFGKKDGTEKLNGRRVPTLLELLDQVDWDWLSDGLPGRFHGDFHFENILFCAEENRFTFLDWRQDFGGLLNVGDIYYDLAKLLHGLIISHELIVRGLFSIDWCSGKVHYEFLRKHILVECEQRFIEFLDVNKYDVQRIKILTALVFLNIAALHHYPYSLLLYCLGKDRLFDSLNG